MDKSPEAFRTISEVAEALKVPPHVLRFWETRFAQVKPVKRGGGRRYYRPEDVRLLRGIRGLLYDDGMTIKGVQKILRERGVRHVIGLGVSDDAGAETVEPETFADAAPPPAAARPEPVAPPPSARPRPQDDLFQTDLLAVESEAAVQAAETEDAPHEDPVPDRASVPVTAAGGADPAPKPLDKAALAALIGELRALRARMIADPET